MYPRGKKQRTKGGCIGLIRIIIVWMIPSTLLLAVWEDKVDHLPGLRQFPEMQMAGYLPVECEEFVYESKSNLFYWFVESRQDASEDPLILWLNGGPGFSGLRGFFSENGPYAVAADMSLSLRDFSWNERANYLIIDQAPGVGFSYADPDFCIRNETHAVEMLHFALQSFFIKYPQLRQNPLYLSGESYAGKILPRLALQILETEPRLNLQGVIVCNGWVDPLVQQSANADFAYAHGLIDPSAYCQVQALYSECANAIAQQTPSSREANQICSKIQAFIALQSSLVKHNICTSDRFDFSHIEKYINQASVRSALHVDPRISEALLFSERVAKELEIGEQDSASCFYSALLETGIRVLICSGLEDGTDSNFMGTELWLKNLQWSGKSLWSTAPTAVWKDSENRVIGYLRKAKGLMYAKIRGAGHFLPMDQPAAMQNILHSFLDETSSLD